MATFFWRYTDDPGVEYRSAVGTVPFTVTTLVADRQRRIEYRDPTGFHGLGPIPPTPVDPGDPMTFANRTIITGNFDTTDGEQRYTATGHSHLYDCRGATFTTLMLLNENGSEGTSHTDRFPRCAIFQSNNKCRIVVYGGYYTRDAAHHPESGAVEADYDYSYGRAFLVGSAPWTNSERVPWSQTGFQSPINSTSIGGNACVLGEGPGDVAGTLMVSNVRVHNSHDGISFAGGDAERVNILRKAYMTHIRDDAVEADGQQNVYWEDSLLDGGFVFFSNRYGKDGGPDVSHTRMHVIKDVVCRLKKTPRPAPNREPLGHMVAFKNESERGAALILINVIMVIEDRDPFQQWEAVRYSENCTLIWMGGGTYPYGSTLPAGWTVINGNAAVYAAARDAWLTANNWNNATAGHGYNNGSGPHGGSVTQPNVALPAEPIQTHIQLALDGGRTITATEPDSVLCGGTGVDTLNAANTGRCIFYVARGGGTMIGSNNGNQFMCGSDTSFNRFNLSTTDGSLNFLQAYKTTDIIDIADCLTAYNEGVSVVANFVRLVSYGIASRHATMEIRPTGAGTWIPLAKIGGGGTMNDLVIATMKAGGRLVMS